MTDPWADRIKLNPKQEILTTVPGAGSTKGSLDSSTTSDRAATEVINSMGKEIKAPKNPTPEWTA